MTPIERSHQSAYDEGVTRDLGGALVADLR
jgi:hypothetical protein